MIEAWTWPAYIGILIGAFAFVVFFVPILIWESRRHGQVRFSRLLGAAAVAVYGVALLAYTLLPLPNADWCAANPAPGRNLQPFSFVEDLLTYYRANGGRALLTSFVFLQVAFNVLLFVPWGALWRRYFGGGIGTAVLSGFLVSVTIEATQTTGAFGLLPCAYRVGDVDDILTNTTGALLGAALAGILLFFMPDPRNSQRTRRSPRPVTRARRLVGMLIDYFSFSFVVGAILVGERAVRGYLLGQSLSEDQPWAQFIASSCAFILVVVLPLFLGNSASLGQRAMWLETQWDGRANGRNWLRALLGFGGWALLNVISEIPGLPADLSGLLSTVAGLFALVTIIVAVFDRSGAGLSVRVAKGQIVDSRSAAGSSRTGEELD